MQSYTSAQKRLLKERFYRWVLNSSDGKRLGWKRASERLYDFTGVEIAPESLRQNLMPVSRKAGKARREFTDPKRFEALHRFLVDTRVGYLTESELDSVYPASVAGFIAMNDYLNSGPKSESFTGMMNALKGRFVGADYHSDTVETIILDIDFTQADRLISSTIQFEDETREGQVQEDVLTYTGWLMANDQGYIQIFVSDRLENEKISYFLLQSSPSITSGKDLEAVALFEYNGVLAGSIQSLSSDREEGRPHFIPTDTTRFMKLLTRED